MLCFKHRNIAKWENDCLFDFRPYTEKSNDNKCLEMAEQCRPLKKNYASGGKMQNNSFSILASW